MPSSEINKFIETWQFPWPVMGVLIGGKSSVDLNELRVSSWEEATKFIKNYGYDPDNKQDAKLIHAVIIEALNFIEKKLMKKEWPKGNQPPKEILFCDDVRHLLLYASDRTTEQKHLQAWSCAVLRVMHTIAHIEGVYQHVDFESARQQIMDRFVEHMQRDRQGRLWLGADDKRVELAAVEWKEYKSRDSVLLKLLHKQANVAETIYDIIGVRLITKRLSDVMIVVKYLREYYLVTFPNCIPTRARNTLIDVDRFKSNVETLIDMLKSEKITIQEFNDLIESKMPTSTKTKAIHYNPHSSVNYKAIQLTCRQLIRTPTRSYLWLMKIKELLVSNQLSPQEKALIESMVTFIEDWNGHDLEREQRAFFPFEVHIVDINSHNANKLGSASHHYYKQSQLRAARRRVLKSILSA